MREKAKVPWRDKQTSVTVGEVRISFERRSPLASCRFWKASMLLNQFVDAHNARGWGEEQPTVLDVRSWAVANHVLDVVIKAVCTWNNTMKTFLSAAP